MGFNLSSIFGGGGQQTVRVADIRDLGLGSEFVASSGVNFQQQDQGQRGDIAYYEIVNTSDQIDFDVSDLMYSSGDTIVEINTIWGSTEFDLIDRQDQDVVISELSGFDSDVWHADITLSSGELRLTNFADTQAAFQPFIKVMQGG